MKRHIIHTILLCLTICVSFGPATLLGEEADIQYGEPRLISKLENRKVNESSGIAASHRDANRFWTHNDSGDRPQIYAFDKQGRDVGVFEIRKAKAIDWEDICSYVRDDEPRLLIADIGDNGTRRKSVKLYLIEDPKDPDSEAKAIQEIKMKYSTGAMDCEAIGVDVESGKILLVEKRRWISCRVFWADLPPEGESKVEIMAEPIGIIEIPLVTGMDVSADGRRAIVLTLGQAFEVTRGEDEDWPTAFKRKPRKINMPPRKQGEAICYGREGRDLYLTSEFSPCPLFLVPAGMPTKR